MKHTPGPWTVKQTRGNNLYEHEILATHKKIAIMATDSYFIKGPGETEKAQAITADARLIAAAPELLEALKALSHQEDWIGEDAPCGSPIGRAWAAIAKAEGRG